MAPSGSSNSASSYQEKVPEPEEAPEYGKKIIYNGHMTIRAEDPSEALKSIQIMCENAGGYLSSSYSRHNDSGSTYATATFRIPADKLEQFMADIKFKGVTGKHLDELPEEVTITELYKLALRYSDGAYFLPQYSDPELMAYARQLKLPILQGPVEAEGAGVAITNFFDSVFSK